MQGRRLGSEHLERSCQSLWSCLWLHSVRSLSPNYGAGGCISLTESLNLFGLLNVFFVPFGKQDVCQRNESVSVKKAAISRIRSAAEVDFTHALGC